MRTTCTRPATQTPYQENRPSGLVLTLGGETPAGWMYMLPVGDTSGDPARPLKTTTSITAHPWREIPPRRLDIGYLKVILQVHRRGPCKSFRRWTVVQSSVLSPSITPQSSFRPCSLPDVDGRLVESKVGCVTFRPLGWSVTHPRHLPADRHPRPDTPSASVAASAAPIPNRMVHNRNESSINEQRYPVDPQRR